MSALISWLYGGQDKRFFDEHAKDIHEYNVKMVNILSVGAMLLLTGYSLFAIITSIDNDVAVYLSVVILMLVLFLLFRTFGSKSIFLTRVFYQLIILALSVFLQIHNVLVPGDLAVFVPAFLVMVPFLQIIPMLYVIEYSALMIASTVIMDIIFKGQFSYNITYDLVDCIICSVIGLLLGQTVLRSRLTQIDAYTKLKAVSETKLARALEVANTDPLTGVGSRAAYESACSELDEKISEGLKDVGFIVCDVNNLKHCNDISGHCAGDDLIRNTSKLICEIFQKENVYRIGGDEFVIILRDEEYTNRLELLNDMRTGINRQNGNVSFASGLAVYDPNDDIDIHSVFIRADAAMYDNKKYMKLAMESEK